MKHDKQMLAWALDRAIETSKLMKDTVVTPESIMAMAEAYTEWVMLNSETENLPENEVN